MGPSLAAFELLGTAAPADPDAALAIDPCAKPLQLDPARTEGSRPRSPNFPAKPTERRKPRRHWKELFSAVPYLELGQIAEEDARNEDAESAYRKAIEIEDTVETEPPTGAVPGTLGAYWKRRRRYSPRWISRVPNRRLCWEISSCWGWRRCWRAANHAGHLLVSPGAGGKQEQRKRDRVRLIARPIEADIQAFQRSEPEQVGALTKSAHEHLPWWPSEANGTGQRGVSRRRSWSWIDGDLTVAVEDSKSSRGCNSLFGAGTLRPGSAAPENGLPGGRRWTEWQTALEARSDLVPASIALPNGTPRSGESDEAERDPDSRVGGMSRPICRSRPSFLAPRLSAKESTRRAWIISNRVSRPSTRPRRRPAFCAERLRSGSIGLPPPCSTTEQAIALDPTSPDAMQGLIRLHGEGTLMCSMPL